VEALVAPMRAQLSQRRLEVALSAVYLCGKRDDEILKWAQMYADERKHRFTVAPTADDVMRSNLLGDETRVRERIDAWIGAGVNYIVIQPMPPREGLREFGERIIPLYS
jgi:alkanesulfonate monooxygenase SsuD/methylene tetrahydromethanopterin reductase-like flavin-dependent oxidoreductase (luciferase family)